MKYFLVILLFFAPFSEAMEELETITIESKDLIDSLVNTPVKTQQKQQEDIEEIQASQTGDVLKEIESVNLTSGPRFQAESPQIRGLDARRILFLLDGAHLNLRTQHNGNAFLDPAFLKQVDVISGPSAALFGAGAVAGLINMETLSPEDLLLPGRKHGGLIGGQNHTVQNLHGYQAMAYTKSLNDGYGLMWGLSTKSTDNMRLSNGDVLDYSAYESTNHLLKYSQKLPGANKVHFITEQYESRSVAPLRAEESTSSKEELSDDFRKRQSFIAQLNSQWMGTNYSFTSYYSTNQLNKVRLSDFRNDLRTTDTLGLDIHGSTKNDFSFGLNYVSDKNDGDRNSGVISFFPDGEANHVGAFVQKVFSDKKKNFLTLGLRGDSFELKSTSDNSLNYSDQKLSSRAGILHYLTDSIQIGANYSEGINPPRIQDIYIDGLHIPPPINNFFIPNPNLKAERAKSYEWIYRHSFNNFLFTYSNYRTLVDNYIYQDIDFFGGTTQLVNIPGVEIKGHEVSLQHEVGSLTTTYSYNELDSLNVENAVPINDSPADSFSINAKYRFASPKFYLGYLGKWTRKQDRLDTGQLVNNKVTQAYNVHDIYAGCTFRLFTKNDSQFQMRVNNFTNKNYRVHGQVLNAPSRDYRVAYKLSF